jgi:type IV pilus biogenesis protein CpaD/CtpE
VTTTLRIRIQLGALAALALSGCAATTPNWDRQFGNAVRATLASQVADPAAARNTNPVSGIDGRAARASQEHYARSFAQPQGSTETVVLVGKK